MYAISKLFLYRIDFVAYHNKIVEKRWRKYDVVKAKMIVKLLLKKDKEDE